MKKRFTEAQIVGFIREADEVVWRAVRLHAQDFRRALIRTVRESCAAAGTTRKNAAKFLEQFRAFVNTSTASLDRPDRVFCSAKR